MVGAIPLDGHQRSISLLDLELADYIAAIERGAWGRAALVAEAGIECPRCGAAPACARIHAWRHRGPVRDIAAGRMFTDIPVLRVVLCTGATLSLIPAALWRGRSTVLSVLRAAEVARVHGIEAAHDWVRARIHGGPGVARSTLGRWRDHVAPRVTAAALAVVAPRSSDPAGGLVPAQALASLDPLSLLIRLAAFRARCGRAVLDRPPRPPISSRTRWPARRLPGRLAPAPPPATGGRRRPRGAWSRSRPRDPPRHRRKEDSTDD